MRQSLPAPRGAVIYQLDGSGVQVVSYDETEQYQLTIAFLEAPVRSLRNLFK